MTRSLISHLLVLSLIARFSDGRAAPQSSDPRIPYPPGQSQMSDGRAALQSSDPRIPYPPGQSQMSDGRAALQSSDPRIPYPSGQSQMSEKFSFRQPSEQVKDSPGRHTTRVKTVAVTCHENYMEIAIKTDLFDVGLPVDASELRLGIDSEFIPSCKVSAFSIDAYIIAAEFTDCGTQHWLTDDSLIYTNFLIFSPQQSPDGVIRLEEAVVPIECYYSRKFDVTSNPIRPTWIPYDSTQYVVGDLQFSLKLMRSDWQSERASSVYFLGDIINIEAAVLQSHHAKLHVYIESCVATVTPDINSVPRYTFIENHGCLMDGQLTGSKSSFLPRIQNDKLQLQLDAFKFHQERRPEIYITCTLQAYPVMDVVNPIHKACSFIDGSWKSADGGDWSCYSCQRQKEFAPAFRSTQEQSGPPSAPKMDQASSAQRLGKFQPRIQAGFGEMPNEHAPFWRSIIIPQEEEEEEEEKSGSVGWEQEKTVGPLSIFPRNTKVGFMAPPRVKEGVPPVPSLKYKTPMPHSSLWKNGPTTKIDFKASATHTPSLESKQANIITSEAEEDYDDEEEAKEGDEDDYGNASNPTDDEERNKKDIMRRWKTKHLPEEDFEETFTTRAPANEKPSAAYALGTSPSLLDKVEPADLNHPLKES